MLWTNKKYCWFSPGTAHIILLISAPPHTKLHVSGSGPMANIYKSMISMFDPIAEASVKIKAGKCTPIPMEPNWSMYEQIGMHFHIFSA